MQGLDHDLLHVAVENCTRLAFAELLPVQYGPACAAFLARAHAWFTALGIPIRQLRTDNAWAYRSRAVRQTLGTRWIRQLRTRAFQRRGTALHPNLSEALGVSPTVPHIRSTWPYPPAFLDWCDLTRPNRALGNVPPLVHFLLRCEQPHEI